MAAESEEWVTEEEVEEVPTDDFEVVSCYTASEEGDRAGEGAEEERDRASAVASSTLASRGLEDARTSVPTSETSEYLQRTAEEEDAGYEAAGEDGQEALEYEDDEEEEERAEGGEEGTGSGFGSQETATTFSASEAGFDTDAMEHVIELQEEDEREAERGGDGEEEEGLVTQRGEDMSYQNTVKDLSAALIERGEKLGAH